MHLMWVEEGGSILKMGILISVAYDMKKKKACVARTLNFKFVWRSVCNIIFILAISELRRELGQVSNLN